MKNKIFTVIPLLFFGSPALGQSKQEIQKKIQKAFPRNYRLVFKVIECESKWNTKLISQTKDYGLFQIHYIWITKKEIKSGIWKNVDWQIEKAKYIIKQQGWKAWVCYKKIRREKK